MKRLIKKIQLNYQIEIITGIHVGGSKESVEIGGIDNPVIKIGTRDNQPYIPGSSIKGKMRSLLEQISGSADVGGNDLINDLFGFAKDGKPSRIIVRDAYMNEKDAEALKENDFLDMPYTEGKWENVIHRIKGTADHPRQIERVPAGVHFNAEFVINVWDDDPDGKIAISLLEKGIKALENDYLGGSGSRGYGQVKFHKTKETEVSFEKYFENENKPV
jgi:CRISPR-associated protein Csm3